MQEFQNGSLKNALLAKFKELSLKIFLIDGQA
jgi:hypothetical protein